MTVALVFRLALLPGSIRWAKQADAQRRKLEALKPEIERLRARYAADSARLSRELLALYRRHGVQPFHPRALLSGLIQLPILGALSGSIRDVLKAGGRFLWIPDLTRPDPILILATAVLSGAAAVLHPAAPREVRLMATVLPVALSALLMWKVSAGLGLYWAVSGAAGMIQSLALRSPRRKG